MKTRMRIEEDSLGKVHIPAQAYYGIQTQRASHNFPISGLRAHPLMVKSMILIKKAAALSHLELGTLDKRRGKAIIKACDEILEGRLIDQFIVDVFQMGAGTSFHMNANEVVANRAEEILGGKRGEYRIVDPHDHVNMGQSTNDVYPATIHLAALFLLRDILLSNLKEIEDSFRAKAKEFDSVIKSGRTHLQDAPPIRLGQEFKAYAQTLGKCRIFIESASQSLLELGLGGSAVGTGLNTLPKYSELAVKHLRRMTGFALKRAEDLREAMQSMRPIAEVSSALRNLALEMNRISNDLRLLCSGPKTGLAEISLPAVAPGSSMMPGKVNPSMLEMMNMVCYQVIGCDLVISGAVQAGQLELNVMMPVMAFNLIFMIQIMGNALKQLKEKCIDGIKANVEQCRMYAESSLGLVTALSPYLGYDRAAELAKEASRSRKSLVELIEEKDVLSKEELRKILDLKRMTEPGIPGKDKRR